MKKDYLEVIGFFLLVCALANILVYSLTFQEAYTRLITVLEARLRGESLVAP